MECTEAVVKALQCSRVFRPPPTSTSAAPSHPPTTTSKVNSIDFSDDGKYCVACDDKTLRVYDAVEKGCHLKDIACRKYGASAVRFTHALDQVLVPSKAMYDDTIRHLSLTENRFLQYFPGHRDRVCSLEMNPRDDTFLSASVDGVVRLWDLRDRYCQGMLQVKGRACVSYDSSGIVFAVSSAMNLVRLFDIRNFEKGSFATFRGNPPPLSSSSSSSSSPSSSQLEITYVTFSVDGKYLLCSTSESYMFILDSFTGEQVQQFCEYDNSNNSVLEPCFTPDGKFVLSGSEDGVVYAWEARTGKVISAKRGQHVSAVSCVRVNPLYLLVASCDYHVVFWTYPTATATATATATTPTASTGVLLEAGRED